MKISNRQHPPLGVVIADATLPMTSGKRASYLPVRFVTP